MRLRQLLLLVQPFALLGCGGGDLVLPSVSDPVRIEIVQGDEQIGTAGRPLDEDLIVRVADRDDNGVPNLTVTWVVATGDGSVTPATGTTDANGRASAAWTLGPSAGPNTVSAVVASLGGVTFRATGFGDDGGGDGPSASRSRLSAEPASIPAVTGSATITATVRDAAGDPVRGAIVTLKATGAGNTLIQPSGTTGPDGIATGVLRSTAPGTKVVSATVNGSVEVRETARVTVTPAAATSIVLLEGNDQSVPAGATVPVRPAVLVTDDAGEPVRGVEVTFVVTGGGGRVSGASRTTDSDGIAQVGSWTLGLAPGTNTLEAQAGSLQGSPVVFTAVATSAGGVERFVFRVQPRDVAENESFTVEVALVDAGGNVVPLSGILIYLGLFREGRDTPTNTELDGERFRQTENGVAVFTDLRVIKHREGYRLRARSDDLPAIEPTFSDPFDVD